MVKTKSSCATEMLSLCFVRCDCREHWDRKLSTIKTWYRKGVVAWFSNYTWKIKSLAYFSVCCSLQKLNVVDQRVDNKAQTADLTVHWLEIKSLHAHIGTVAPSHRHLCVRALVLVPSR